MPRNSVPTSSPQGDRHPPEPGRNQTADHLRELIAALDARLPRLERAGEIDIVRDAARLKRDALTRLAHLDATHADEH